MILLFAIIAVLCLVWVAYEDPGGGCDDGAPFV